MDKSFDYDKESREALIAKLEEQEARKEAREEAAQIRKEKFNQAKWEFYRKAENKSKMLSNVGFNMPIFDTNFRIKDTKEEVKFTQEMGVDFVWVHDAATVLEATLAHSLNSTGTKCLVVEMGVGERINHSMCFRLRDGILHLMHEMGMWKGEAPADHLADSIVCNKVEFLNAETSGIFITELKCGFMVEKSQEIGQIVEPLTGKILSRVISPVDGYLFTIRAYPIVYEGSLMARIYHEN